MAKKQTPNQRHEVNREEFRQWKAKILRLEKVIRGIERAIKSA